MKQHEPKILRDPDSEYVCVQCEECGKILWISNDDCPGQLPPLSVVVEEKIRMTDKVG
jgi:hypothetical protein